MDGYDYSKFQYTICHALNISDFEWATVTKFGITPGKRAFFTIERSRFLAKNIDHLWLCKVLLYTFLFFSSRSCPIKKILEKYFTLYWF